MGIGSSFGTVSGLGMIGAYYDDDISRIEVMGRAMSGLALGVLVGPPFSSVLAELVDIDFPFVILTVAVGITWIFGMMIKYNFALHVTTHKRIPELLKEKKILVTGFLIFVANVAVSALETGQPLQIQQLLHEKNMGSGILLKGLSFIPTTVGYGIGSNFISTFFDIFGGLTRTSTVGSGSVISGLFIYSLIKHLSNLHLILTVMAFGNFLVGFGVGLVDNAQFSILGLLFKYGDFGNNYGSIFAIGDMAFCAAFTVGPIATASLGEHLGFPRTLEFLGVVLLLCSPLILLLDGNYQRSRSMNYEPIRRNSHSVYFENKRLSTVSSETLATLFENYYQ